MSELQQESAPSAVTVDSIALLPADRAAHARAIERRFAAMVEQGFIEEVRSLRQRPGLTADSPSMRAVGYRQIWAFLDGGLNWDEAAQRAVAATRQLAKRQQTWLRSDLHSEKFDVGDTGLPEQLRQRAREVLAGA